MLFAETVAVYCENHMKHGAVGIATGYGLDDRGVEFESRWGQEFSLLRVVQGGSSFFSNACLGRCISPAVKLPGHEADHSPPTSDGLKKTWIYTSTPP
jgi:hypothetical protein